MSDGAVTASQVVDTNGSGHGALAGFLQAHGVDALICGGIGGGARTALAQAGITLYPGVSGDAGPGGGRAALRRSELQPRHGVQPSRPRSRPRLRPPYLREDHQAAPAITEITWQNSGPGKQFCLPVCICLVSSSGGEGAP